MMTYKGSDDSKILVKSDSLLNKDIESNINIEDEEINPHNEISGIHKFEESNPICESLASQ